MQLLVSAVSPRVQFVRRVETLSDIVHSNSPIETTRDNIRMLFVEVQTGDRFHLFLSLEHALGGPQIPDLDQSVVVS